MKGMLTIQHAPPGLQCCNARQATLKACSAFHIRQQCSGPLHEWMCVVQRLPSLKKHLPESTIEQLADVFQLKTYDAGEVITVAGKRTDRIFVIKTGSCVLSQVATPSRTPCLSVARTSAVHDELLMT